MRIALDLDGVCYEFDRTQRYMLREYRGVNIPGSTTHWDYVQEACSRSDWLWVWEEGVKLGLFRYGHMVTGTRIGLQALIAAGHKLEVVTHRPAQSVNDTLAWLDLYFKDIPLHGVHLLTDQRSKVKASSADVLIDDKWRNVEEWSREGRAAVLFGREWNAEPHEAHMYQQITRADGWRETVNIIEAMQ